MNGASYSSFRAAGALGDGGEPDDPEPLDKVDASGNPIPEGETPETEIEAWEIGFDQKYEKGGCFARNYDRCVIRDYNRAMQYAQDGVETFMDGATSNQELRLTVRLRSIPLQGYLSSTPTD